MSNKLISVVLATTLCVLQYRLWAGEGSVAHLQSMRAEIGTQEQVNEQLRLRNQQIDREIVSLKTDPEAIEARARRELGMIKTDEIYYLFVDEEGAERSLSDSNAH